MSFVIAITGSHVVGTADIGITWGTTEDRTHLIGTQGVTDEWFSETLQCLFIDLRIASNSRFRNITRNGVARVTSKLQKSERFSRDNSKMTNVDPREFIGKDSSE